MPIATHTIAAHEQTPTMIPAVTSQLR